LSAFDVLLERAQSLFRAGSVAEACDALRCAVSTRPHDAQLALLHAQLLGAAGDAAYALAEARRAMYIAPNNGPVRAECNRLVAQLERRAVPVT
jgi:Flp pilus assembly protein TadD